MATTHRSTTATPAAIFAVLADPWRYADWVVGAREIRDADPSWPSVGSRFHHRVGAGPAQIADSTQVVECEPPSRLVLRASFRPAGEACIDLTLEPRAGGTLITMREWPVAGPARRLFGLVLDTATHLRNRVALRRLCRLALRTPVS